VSGLVSGVWRLAERNPMSPEDQFEMARDIWRRNVKGDPIIIWPDLVTNDFDRQHLVNIATKQYGQRAKRRG
jgi:hypothetical protein